MHEKASGEDYEIADAIESAYRENERVIVDLSRLDYLDGSDLLIRFAEEARGRFVVVGSKASVHRLFTLLRLVDALPPSPLP